MEKRIKMSWNDDKFHDNVKKNVKKNIDRNR